MRPELAEVDLTGLSSASPIAFMAALGLLRVLSQDHALKVALSWRNGRAQLHGITARELTEVLPEHMRGRAEAPEFQFQVAGEKGMPQKVQHLRSLTPGDYRGAVQACRGNARALGFLAGFATDAVVNEKGFVARTRLDFTSGQQRMAEEMRKLAEGLDPRARRPARPLPQRIAAALYGGAYEEQHTFGWDPAALMTHAHLPTAPSDSATPGQPMTVWLAVEALPLHPVLPTSPTRAATTGFAASKAYIWPEWTEPLTLAEVTLLRARPVQTLHNVPDVTAVWCSDVTSVGKYGFLRPAARTSSVDANPRGFAQAQTAGE